METTVERIEKYPKHKSSTQEAMGRLVKNRTAMLGFFVLIVIVLACLFANVICPEGYDAQNIPARFTPPCKEYIFGTDNLGRSLLARILYGGRYSILIGIGAATVGMVGGVLLGLTAAYYGGRVDNIIMRILDVFNAIPSLLMAIVVSSLFGGTVFNCIMAVGIAAIPANARTARGPALAIMNQDYIEAAKSIDAGNFRIMLRHVLPNISSVLIVRYAMGIGFAILTTSGLSFLGLGVKPPTPEWGAMLSGARQYMVQSPYLIIIPGLAIALIVLATNLFGDGLRDALDPKLKY
jgi:ABC-type dipeptide/oligopeptide/nickel transport system permease subunit